MTREVVITLIAIALLAAVGAGPFAGLSSQRTITESSPSVNGPAVPAFFFWFVFVGQASCSLATGVCTTTIVNAGTNSSYDLAVDSCHMDIIYYSDNQVTKYTSLQGTVGGFVANRLPAMGVVTSTCAVPIPLLTYEPNGQLATGSFTMELVNSLGSLPPGKNASVEFQGIWTASPAPVTTTSTVTSMSTVTITTTSTVMPTATTTTTKTVTTANGGIPELPYQLLAASIIIVLLVVSYLVVRHHPVRT